ncbi:MAG: peptidylprolyl isomerase [Bacteroidota bacterium]|nr:peptidylprolyl isomerase [Bacteroidota bacterium]
MKPFRFLYLIILIGSLNLVSQSQEEYDIEKRQTKLEIILRMQDTRTIHDGKLVSFLTDADPIIRERTVLAFGSIQDTFISNLLVDRLMNDPEVKVQVAAAFAIGQTAGSLSKEGKQKLQHDLIWTRLERMSHNPKERLIEEIGKFGSKEALEDLILRYGNVNPPVYIHGLTMCIARYAIRGIISKEAVHYLLKYITPVESVSWQVVYALQRIGDHAEIRGELEKIVQLYKHRDPLVRMNLATLLAKVKDDKINLEPLQKLADFDGDWRVRVNALKALSNYDLKNKDDIVRTFRRSFFAGNMNIAVTALSSFGNTGLEKDDGNQFVKETFTALEKITVNKDDEYQWQLQAEAALALAKLVGKNAITFIKPSDYPQPLLQAQLLTAMGLTGSPEAAKTLVEYLNDSKPILYRAALEGLMELCKKNPNDGNLTNGAYNSCINALGVKDVAVISAAASMLGDSIFLKKTSVEPLLETISRLHIPDDIEAIQEIASTLGKLKDMRAVEHLKILLRQRDRSIVLAAASALKSITDQDYTTEIPRYMEPIFTDYDFKFLHSLTDTVKVKMETIRGDVLMELYKNIAPFTVMSFLKLATQRAFYRGLSFHRIVPNFVVQGGDPRGDGWGGPGYSIRSEFSPLTYETGMLGMASSGKDTEGSQFFITQSPQPHLDGRYTIFGKVISGMDVINKIQLDDHIFDIKIIQ